MCIFSFASYVTAVYALRCMTEVKLYTGWSPSEFSARLQEGAEQFVDALRHWTLG